MRITLTISVTEEPIKAGQYLRVRGLGILKVRELYRQAGVRLNQPEISRKRWSLAELERIEALAQSLWRGEKRAMLAAKKILHEASST